MDNGRKGNNSEMNDVDSFESLLYRDLAPEFELWSRKECRERARGCRSCEGKPEGASEEEWRGDCGGVAVLRAGALWAT